MLFEVRCPGCDRLGWCPCGACIELLADPQSASVPNAASVGLLFSHEGVGREFIHALKYRRERAIARWLGESLALNHLSRRRDAAEGAVDGAVEAAVETAVDTVTFAPTTAAHRRARGFDQAEILARATARALRVRCARLLDRVGSGVQSGADRTARLAGPQFRARSRSAGLRVLLVDDVLTTGATLRSAAAALLDEGAAQVHVAACARRGRDSLGQVA